MDDERVVRELEYIDEEIACLGGLMDGLTKKIPEVGRNPAIIAAFRRIDIRLRDIRAGLTTGMK